MTTTIQSTERVRVEELEPHPENARRGNIEAIKESLLTHGQYRTIVANRRDKRVLAGNHTFMALQQLGREEVDVSWVDVDELEGLKLLLVDNRLSDIADYDDPMRAAALERLMLAGQLEGTGYDPDAVDDLLAEMDALPETQPGEFQGAHAVSDEELAQRFANRAQVTLRQFVLMYDQEVASEVEEIVRKLEKDWGVSGMRDVVLEALRRAS